MKNHTNATIVAVALLGATLGCVSSPAFASNAHLSGKDIETSLSKLFTARAQAGVTGVARSSLSRMRPMLSEAQRAVEISMASDIRSFTDASNNIEGYESEDLSAESKVSDVVVRSRESDKTVVSSYEITEYTWRHKGGSEIMTSGFGIHHTTTLEEVDGVATVVSDLMHESHGMMRESDAAKYVSPDPFSATESPSEEFDHESSSALDQGREVGSVAPASQISLDKGKVVDYARKYALEYNKSYVYFPLDCTNFASQAMREGGWDFMRADKELGEKSWWYSSRRRKWSKSWVDANNFYRWLKRSGRAVGLASPSRLRPGDIMQIGTPGRIDVRHSTMVTGSLSGEPTFTYHTTNTKDKPWHKVWEASGKNVSAYHSWGIV